VLPSDLAPAKTIPALGGTADPRAEIASQLPRRGLGVGFLLAVAWMGTVSLVAIFVDILPFQDPLAINPGAGRAGPSVAHLLGTDQLGRDLLARVAHGAQVSLFVGIVATGLGMFFGSLLGLLAGFYRRRTETIIMGGVDMLLAFPGLILVIALAAFLGPSIRNLVIAIGVFAIPAFARLVRAQTLTIAERDFVKVARTQGASDLRLMVRELAPNVLPTILTYALVVIAIVIVVEGSLSFLGLGIPPPRPTWGGMIASGKGELSNSPHVSMVPAAVMFLTVLSLNLIGGKLSTRFDLRGEEG
jgi:peptide/nickel transport system permease protein